MLQWLTTPMPIFLSVGYRASSGRSRPFVLAHSNVITSAFSCQKNGSARAYDGRSQYIDCWFGFPQHVCTHTSVSSGSPSISRFSASVRNCKSSSVVAGLRARK